MSAAVEVSLLGQAIDKLSNPYDVATLFDIAGERSSTIVFPFPVDLMKAWTTPAGG